MSVIFCIHDTEFYDWSISSRITKKGYELKVWYMNDNEHILLLAFFGVTTDATYVLFISHNKLKVKNIIINRQTIKKISKMDHNTYAINGSPHIIEEVPDLSNQKGMIRGVKYYSDFMNIYPYSQVLNKQIQGILINVEVSHEPKKKGGVIFLGFGKFNSISFYKKILLKDLQKELLAYVNY